MSLKAREHKKQKSLQASYPSLVIYGYE